MTLIAAQQFQHDVEKVLVSIGECSDALERLIVNNPDLSDLVSQSNALGGRVTVMEPMVLYVEIKKLLSKIKDLELISDIQHHDPERKLTGETGQSWYQLAKGDLTVTAIKELRSAIRNSFKQPNFDVAEAKRICELVKEGQI